MSYNHESEQYIQQTVIFKEEHTHIHTHTHKLQIVLLMHKKTRSLSCKLTLTVWAIVVCNMDIYKHMDSYKH